LRAYFIYRLDHAAQLRGVTGQSLIKTWLYDLLKQELPPEASKLCMNLEHKSDPASFTNPVVTRADFTYSIRLKSQRQ
jgi:hypothetical protein